jgi:tRNA(Ile)-lysidine synthase
MKNFDKAIHLFLQSLGDLKNKKILVGYSAGADSTLLLHLLAQKKDFFEYHLEAVFFSHENSPINEGENNNLLLAQKTCQSLNIPFYHQSIHMEKTTKKSWEQIGRQARLEFYQKHPTDFIFLGHHLDDQNETTMIQLFRGAGKGMRAMKPIDGKICRPLLDISKKDIYDYLQFHKIRWIEDPTNKNTDFTRNFWRNIGLPTIANYYPSYSLLLSKFRKKIQTLENLSLDLAKVDGLDSLLQGKTIQVSHLSETRIMNLFHHLYPHLKSSLEEKVVEEFFKQNNFIKKEKTFLIGDYSLCFQHGTLSLISKLEKKSNSKLKV